MNTELTAVALSGETALRIVDEICVETIRPQSASTDESGAFPSVAVERLLSSGFGGLTSSVDAGGSALGFGETANVVRRIASDCASTGMILTMHLCAAAAVETLGSVELREEVARGEHLLTLAFSEAGSRSHFWAPLSTAVADGDEVVLDADKSWVTSAGFADSYVWLSRSLSGEGTTLWAVPRTTPGISVGDHFDGLGLRGNGSVPVTARDVRLPRAAMLGEDGSGVDLALATVLPWFQVLSAACSLGLCDAAIASSVAHLTTARLEHLDQSLAEQAVPRSRLGQIQSQTDAASALLADACVALETDRPDAPLRMLESKAFAAETAIHVTGEAMRLGGGAAFRKDVGIERQFRDARAAAVMAPTSDALHDMIGRALCGLPLL